MIFGKQYQVTKRDRLHTSLARNGNISKYSTLSTNTKYTTSPAEIRLEDCLSITPKSINIVRSKCKLTDTKEEHPSLGNHTVISQACAKNRSGVLSPRYTEDGHLTDLKYRSNNRYLFKKETKEWKNNFEVEDYRKRRPTQKQNQTQVWSTKPTSVIQKQTEVYITNPLSLIEKQTKFCVTKPTSLIEKQTEVCVTKPTSVIEKHAEVCESKATTLIKNQKEMYEAKITEHIQQQKKMYEAKTTELIQQQEEVCASVIIEDDLGFNDKLPKNQTSLGEMSAALNYVAIKRKKVPALGIRSLTAPNIQTPITTTLPTAEKYQVYSRTRNKISLKIMDSLISKKHSTFKAPKNSKNSSIPPGAKFRCHTSMGHYPALTEQRTRTTKSAGFSRSIHATDEHGSSLSHSQIADMAARLDVLIIENNICKFQTCYLCWDSTTRQKIVNYKSKSSSSSSVFFRACQLSRIDFVKLMLKECSVDLELTGVFNVPYDDTVFQVTPLWSAAASCNLDLVRLLISSGANINATSSTGCTVVRAACCVSSVAIVVYLIGQGADILAQNEYGVTCLMSGIMSPDIIKILINNGSNINDVDFQGNTVLHYAAEAGRLDTVKLLIERGSNALKVNNDNNHAIQIAAIHGQTEVVDYFLRVTTPRLDELIDIFLVLGSVCILMDTSYSHGCVYWQKAIELKRLSKKSSLTKFRSSVLSDIVDVSEITTVEELSVMWYNHEALCSQALLIYERIRGSLDENFLNLLMYRGAVSADNQNSTLAISLWKTAYKLRLHKYLSVSYTNNKMDIFNISIINNVRCLLKIVHATSQEGSKTYPYDNKRYTQMPISGDVISEVFQTLYLHVFQSGVALKENNNGNLKFCEVFTFLLKAFFTIFYIYSTMFPTATCGTELGTYLHRLIRLNPRGAHSETLLHICLNCQLLQTNVSDAENVGHKMRPSFVILEMLLLLGADPLATDSGGNTVMHLAVHLHMQGVTLDTNYVKKLLRLGVHPDQVNHQGHTAFDMLPPCDNVKQILQQPNLKCLAARTIVSHNISYIGEVPECLHTFIELHA